MNLTIADLGHQLDEIWPRFRAAVEAMEAAEAQLRRFTSEAMPAALRERPGDRGLFHPAFYPAEGDPYSEAAILRLREAAARPNSRASDQARRRVEILVAANERWSSMIAAFRATIGWDALQDAYDVVSRELFSTADRLRDTPALTIDELRIKAREWNRWTGAADNKRFWNNPDERPDADDCLLGSLLADLVGDISPSAFASGGTLA